MPTFLVVLLWAPAVHAQVAVAPGGLEAVGQAAQRIQRNHAPAKADKAALDALVDRLTREGDELEDENDPGWALEGRALSPGSAPNETLRAVLHGGRLPPRELGEPGSGFSDLALRFAYSHLVASQEFTQELEGGLIEVDSWTYVVDMDGSIRAAVRVLVVAKAVGDDLQVDERRSRVIKFDPRDPTIANRWKALQPKLLRLGRLLEV